jgi:nitrite reductase/ring-hydroxylating ferredoxin subunit
MRLRIALADIPNPGAKAFVLEEEDGRKTAGFIVRIGLTLKAYVNSCPHTGAPLNWSENRFLDFTQTEILCTMHGARFIPETGHCRAGPCKGRRLAPISLNLNGELVEI